MYLNPGLAKDTGLMTYDILWKDEDNAHFVYTLGGFQAAQTDIIFSSDSSTYRLPADVKNITGILVGDGTTWEPAVPNPMFAKDLGPRQFDVHFKARDTALLYLRGTFQDDDTVRVFYQKTLQANDTIRVEYVGIPTDMALSSTDCAVPDDLEEFLVEEAIGYYFTYKNDEVKAQAWWQKVRLDMGVLEPPKK